MASPEEPDFVQAKHRLEEAKLGLMTAKLEVEFWQQRIQELESVINAAKTDESLLASINATGTMKQQFHDIEARFRNT